MPDFRGGGAEQVMVTLAQEIARRGFDVCLVVLRAHGPLAVDGSAAVHQHVLDARTTRAAVSGLRRWLQAWQPQVLLVSPSHLGWAAAWAARATTTRVFIREASTLSAELAALPWTQRWIRLAAEKYLCRNVRRGALSHRAAADLAHCLRLPPDRICVLPNPVISATLWQRGAHRVAQTPAALDPNRPMRYLSAGRLDRQKGMDVLIRAFAALKPRPGDRLLIAGEGAERPALEALANTLGVASQVEFLGYRVDLIDLMLEASAFVLASRWEGLPGVLIQALASGLPVVATDAPGGAAEILEQGRWGRLVPVEDVHALSAAMQALRYERPGQPDDAWRQRYDIVHATDRYLDFMDLPYRNGDSRPCAE
ncbi:Glycosyltransferase involved in cell wall bisynthesis [Fontimonas thermophila]|uniref:Glycosyltransferase involved in cell wall bisynthesis n=1 Tax=Fontimonas thermophila TaxID=1076937 RepID=A0A1I2K0R0_9GAMM|nr:glycosyltransferase [Fontimonas thermophila]SFF60755.1 Glycosyltransferase involved in cell wall bisynthesis [Fontimonas thermophila]